MLLSFFLHLDLAVALNFFTDTVLSVFFQVHVNSKYIARCHIDFNKMELQF